MEYEYTLGGKRVMAERFSLRHGYAPSDAEIIVREDAPEELRSVLVDIAYEAGLSPHGLRSIVCTLLRRREDPNNWSPFPNVDGEARYHVDTCEWYIIEAIAEDVENPGGFESELNQYFRRRGIGWQLVGGEIQIRGPEAFEQAVSEARQELEAASRATAAKEIHEALQDLSRRPDPDLTGCIQHSLAALECVARDVVGDPRATLGAILKKHPGLLPRPLDAGAEKLWGFASEQGRHLREGREPGPEDAELVVHVSAALSIYLSRKTEL